MSTLLLQPRRTLGLWEEGAWLNQRPHQQPSVLSLFLLSVLLRPPRPGPTCCRLGRMSSTLAPRTTLRGSAWGGSCSAPSVPFAGLGGHPAPLAASPVSFHTLTLSWRELYTPGVQPTQGQCHPQGLRPPSLPLSLGALLPWC